MRIIKGGDAAADRRLAAWMLNTEHGARVVGDDLRRLPPPHAPSPALPLGPATAGGVAATLCYKPSLGVVFYTARGAPDGGETARQLALRLASMLDAAGDGHLREPRAVAATPVAVARAVHAVVDNARAVREQPPGAVITRVARAAGDVAAAARLLVYGGSADAGAPEPCSRQAAFTWVFLPAAAALAIAQAGFTTLAAANAFLAGALYDAAGACNQADGADAETLAPFDFGRPMPAAVDARRVAALCDADALAYGPRSGALVFGPERVRDGVAVAYAGTRRALAAAATTPVPCEPWRPRYGRRCGACHAPLTRLFAVARGLQAPPAGAHRAYVLGPDREMPPELVLCRYCADGYGACLTGHMRGAISWGEAPFSQAEACADCPGCEALAPLLAGAARPAPGVPGAYLVRLVTGEEVALASPALGSTPHMTHALAAPVIPNVAYAVGR